MIMLFLMMQQDKFLVVNIVFIMKGLLKKTPMEYVQQMTHHELFIKNSSKNIFLINLFKATLWPIINILKSLIKWPVIIYFFI